MERVGNMGPGDGERKGGNLVGIEGKCKNGWFRKVSEGEIK